MSKLPKILLSETILIERQYFVESVAKVNEVSIASEANSLTSSKAINAGRMMTINCEVHMFGCVGKDAEGKRALIDLVNYGIKPTYVTKTSKARTGEVLVMTGKNGDSAFTVFLGANRLSDLDVLNSLKQFDFVYAASSMDLKKLYQLIDNAHRVGVRIFLDFPGQQKQFNKGYLKNIDFTVPNRHEAELMLGVKIKTTPEALRAAQELRRFTKGNIVISLDKDGCVLLASGEALPKHVPTKKVRVVDTTASGDIFRGVLLSKYLDTHNIEESVKKALEIATKSCEISGVDKSIRLCRELYH